MSTKAILNWVTILMLVVFIGSIGIWFFRLERIPNEIRIATGVEGGLYFQVGSAIADSLQKRTGRGVEIKETFGSQANFELLEASQVEFAIIQGGSVPLEQLSVVTPLFPELLFVVVKNGSNITSVNELVGTKVAIGPQGSGNRTSALKLLEHFHIDANQLNTTTDHFKVLLTDQSLDAAIVTAGVEHPDLQDLLATNEFELVPVDIAPAIELVNPFLRHTQIPQGLFDSEPAVPDRQVPTVATTAYLVTQHDAPDDLVRAALACIHEESLRLHVPTLVQRQDASDLMSTRMHPVALRYFNPSDNIGLMANVMESLAAMKELLFAFGAGVYLLWIRWRRLKDEESQKLLSHQKEHLDIFLAETLRIEEAQLKTDDMDELRDLLDQVTRIKLKALYEFTEEELRSDQAFSIFLDQCTALISKIQLKMMV